MGVAAFGAILETGFAPLEPAGLGVMAAAVGFGAAAVVALAVDFVVDLGTCARTAVMRTPERMADRKT